MARKRAGTNAANRGDAELVALIARYRAQREKVQTLFERTFVDQTALPSFNTEADAMAAMRRAITDTTARTTEGLRAKLAIALDIMTGGDVHETMMPVMTQNTICASAVSDALAALA